MRLLSRVVWSEGMYLGPHHFQAQSRYFEDSIQFATATLWYASFGLVGVELDAEALHNGTVSLVHARGILPDGLPFNMPESDALPDARAVADLFPPTRDFITVMLAIPPRKANGYNCAIDDDSAEARYLAETRVLHDENSGADERPVRLGRKNLRLLFDTEPPGDQLTLPIARVIRDGSGHYAYDPTFVPPVLQISASIRLMNMIKRLIGLLQERHGQQRAAHWIENRPGLFHPRDRQLLAAALREFGDPPARAPARRQARPPRGTVRRDVAAGWRALHVRPGFTPAGVALVRPSEPHRVLEKLERHIRLHLETIIPTNCISIPLRRAGNYYWEGEVTDQRCLGRSRWVFAIHADMGEAELMAQTPKLIKVCTPPFVRELVKRALPGMTLTHLPVPPPAISARVETQYFGISRSGPCWDHLIKAHQVGVYVPGEFPNPEVEILVVLDNQSNSG